MLIITTTLWLLKAYDYEHNVNIELKLNYKNLPDDLGVSSETPKSCIVKVIGTARQLSKIEEKFDVPLVLSGKNIIYRNNENYLLPEYINEKVSSLFTENIAVLGIEPDTLFLKLQKIDFKKVPVKLQSDIQYEQQYTCFQQPQITPDSIIIKGKKEEIDKINEVYTKKISIQSVSSDINTVVELMKIPNIQSPTNSVALYLPVEKYTEKNLSIYPEIINLPEYMKIIIFPKKANITFKVAVAKHDLVSEKDFQLTIDCQRIKQKTDGLLIPKITKKPDYVKNINIMPQVFEYFIEKKIDETNP